MKEEGRVGEREEKEGGGREKWTVRWRVGKREWEEGGRKSGTDQGPSLERTTL